LSVEHRETLELTYYFGYSCAEVAQCAVARRYCQNAPYLRAAS
jgi:hypothetical protein